MKDKSSVFTRRIITWGLAMATSFGWLAGGGGTLHAASVPAGFTESVVSGPTAGSWNEALGLTFESTGRMWVWERGGRVWIKDPSDSGFSLLLDISEEVGNWDDHGFLGLAIDPGFRVNGFFYVMYVVDRHHLINFGTGSYDPNQNQYDSATIGRITRYTCTAASNFRTVNPASRFILVGETRQTGIPVLSTSHSVGTLLFAQDGTLLASTGDGASAWTTDLGGAAAMSYACLLYTSDAADE